MNIDIKCVYISAVKNGEDISLFPYYDSAVIYCDGLDLYYIDLGNRI